MPLCPHLCSACSWPLSVIFKWCRVQRSLKAKTCKKNIALCTYVTPNTNKNLKVEQREPTAFLLSANLSFTVPVMDWQKKACTILATWTNLHKCQGFTQPAHKEPSGFFQKEKPSESPGAQTHNIAARRCAGAPYTPYEAQALPVTHRGIKGPGSGNAHTKSAFVPGHGCEAPQLTAGSCFNAYWIYKITPGSTDTVCKLLTGGGWWCVDTICLLLAEEKVMVTHAIRPTSISSKAARL